jgi:hypothetical protein
MKSSETQLTFKRNMSPSSSRSKGKPRRKPANRSYCLLHGGFLLGLLFDPEEGGMFLQAVS